MISRKAIAHRKPIALVKLEDPHPSTEITSHETASMSQATESPIPQTSHELEVKRPPVRKYIRKMGIPGFERAVVEVVEQKPKEITLASLKEKFGLSESKGGGIMRDAEKLGKLKRVVNG